MKAGLNLTDRILMLAGLIGVIVIIGSGLVLAKKYFLPATITSGDHPEDISPEARFGSLERMAPITPTDHVRGKTDAPVKIVEYLDTECSFCKRSYLDMQKALKEYDGKIALVYRHYPLPTHSRSRKEAEALECANELGGNDAFWKYADRIYEITPSGNKLDPAELPKIAEYVSLDSAKFNACLAGEMYAEHVEENARNAIATGVNGNPWSIIVAQNGKKYPLSGAQPYASVKQLIDLALQEK